jgi:hypothetical protein
MGQRKAVHASSIRVGYTEQRGELYVGRNTWTSKELHFKSEDIAAEWVRAEMKKGTPNAFEAFAVHGTIPVVAEPPRRGLEGARDSERVDVAGSAVAGGIGVAR